MRVRIASKKARKGDRVRLHAALKPDMTYAFCEVFVQMKDGDPSPYVPMAKLALIDKSKPMMFDSTAIRLSPAKRTHMIELVADDNCRFFLMQDIDVKGDTLVKGKVEVHGRFRFALERAFGWLR